MTKFNTRLAMSAGDEESPHYGYWAGKVDVACDLSGPDPEVGITGWTVEAITITALDGKLRKDWTAEDKNLAETLEETLACGDFDEKILEDFGDDQPKYPEDDEPCECSGCASEDD
jgi:hypothetical protein